MYALISLFRKVEIVLMLAAVGSLHPLMAQNQAGQKENNSKTRIKNMVDSQQFDFLAQNVVPLHGQYRVLTSPYDIRIAKDSIISYLPYFGRVYATNLNPSDAGLNFISTRYSYKITSSKKDRWNILIQPKDNKDVQQLLFTIFDNGSASLSVNFSSRDPITFNGILQPVKTSR